MSGQPVVQLLSRPAELAATYPVVKQLRPHLEAHDYLERLERLMAAGYRLAAVRADGELLAVAGFRLGESLAWGRYLYVDDLVTAESARSLGFGKLLLDWLKAEARSNGCSELHLDSGVQRHGAHRFYLRERMDITALHIKIALE
jgi:GNAT superfamily N-acetyltransferase